MPYDPSPLLDFVPSFWRDYYENRDQIVRLWEGFSRLMDDEFASAEQMNDASNPGSCPDFIFHTYLYKKLEDWKSHGIAHSHYRVDFRATASQTIFYLGFWPDPAEVQIFVDGKEVDTSTDPYVVTFQQDATQPGTNPSGARLIFEDPKVLNTPITVATDKTVYRYDVEVPPGGLTTVTFPDVVDPDSIQVVLEKLNMTSSFTITSIGFSWLNLTPAVHDPRFFRRGETYELLDTVTNISTFVTVNTDTEAVSATIANPTQTKVYRVIGLDISHKKVELSGDVLSFSGQTFPVSMRVRPADAYGSESAIPERPVNVIAFDRSFDPSSQNVYFLGGKIDGGYTASDDEVVFDRSFMVGTVVSVEGAIENPNDHASHRVVTTSVTDTVFIDPSRPFLLTPGLIAIPEYPVLVFVDGILQHPDSYTFISTSRIQLAGFAPIGTVIDVFYVDLEDPIEHLHVRETFRIDLPTSAFELEDYVSEALNPMVTVDGKVVSDPDEMRFNSGGKFLKFTDWLATGSVVKVRGAHPSLKYYHEIDPTIISAAYLQDGIDERSEVMPGGWTTQLAWETGFNLADGILDANAKIEDAWFVDVYVDERTAYWNFGVLLGISRETSKEYVDVVRAVFSGNYMGSQPETIENYACIILGSEYLSKAEVITSIIGDTVTANGSTYELMPNVPQRIETGLTTAYKKYHALSAGVRIIDNWASFDILAIIGDKFSDDYTFAQTLDTHRMTVLLGGNATFFATEARLDDPSTDFLAEEVWPGDLIALYDVATPTVPAYGRVTKVERHSLWADVPLTVTVSGYGEGYYGQWVYGGGYSIISVDSYKVWNRKTDRLDLFERLDEALPDNVPYLASVLHNLLSSFVFLADVSWAAVKDDTALRDMVKFIERVKPADTNYIPFTKPNEEDLKEDIDGVLVDNDPAWTVVPNFLFVSTDVGGFIGVDGQVNPNVGSFIGT
jgi:hypothetical protein